MLLGCPVVLRRAGGVVEANALVPKSSYAALLPSYADQSFQVTWLLQACHLCFILPKAAPSGEQESPAPFPASTIVK